MEILEPIKIHPFDIYEMLSKMIPADVLKAQKGTMKVEMPYGGSKDCALVEINEKLYCVTTTVPPVTKEII